MTPEIRLICDKLPEDNDSKSTLTEQEVLQLLEAHKTDYAGEIEMNIAFFVRDFGLPSTALKDAFVTSVESPLLATFGLIYADLDEAQMDTILARVQNDPIVAKTVERVKLARRANVPIETLKDMPADKYAEMLKEFRLD
jgi:hypothetical protein